MIQVETRQLALLAIVVAVLALSASTHAGQDPTPTISVDLKLRSGGEIRGAVIDKTDDGLVILTNAAPYVFAWGELEGGCAYDVRRSLLMFERGGIDKFTAEDHFQMGIFALRQGRNDLAANAFAAAAKLNKSYKHRADAAFEEFRRRGEEWNRNKLAYFDARADRPDVADVFLAPCPGIVENHSGEDEPDANQKIAPLSAEVRGQVHGAYLAFGEKVREELGKDLDLLESEHFLIWTDWPRDERPLLTHWAEAMYAALSTQFGLAADAAVFLDKCPMFCFQRPARFRKFAQKFDGYSGKEAVGYTRSAEQTGHVHVVLVRQGDSRIDFERFAVTLVHEGTHAFLHRLYSPKLMPHWVNEGYADLMAERVLGPRCPTGENAGLLAREYVKFDWPISRMLSATGPIAVQEYAIAQSVVAYLDTLGKGRLTRFIRALKDGRSTSAALAECFDRLTMQQLEDNWREYIQAADPLATPTGPAGEAKGAP